MGPRFWLGLAFALFLTAVLLAVVGVVLWPSPVTVMLLIVSLAFLAGTFAADWAWTRQAQQQAANDARAMLLSSVLYDPIAVAEPRDCRRCVHVGQHTMPEFEGPPFHWFACHRTYGLTVGIGVERGSGPRRCGPGGIYYAPRLAGTPPPWPSPPPPANTTIRKP